MERQEFVEMPVTRMDMLRLMFPGRMYAIELFFDAGKGTPPYSIFRRRGALPWLEGEHGGGLPSDVNWF